MFRHTESMIVAYVVRRGRLHQCATPDGGPGSQLARTAGKLGGVYPHGREASSVSGELRLSIECHLNSSPVAIGEDVNSHASIHKRSKDIFGAVASPRPDPPAGHGACFMAW